MKSVGKPLLGNASRLPLACLAILLVAPLVVAGPVRIDVVVDDPVLGVGETTVGHVFATVENGELGNGVYAYALSVLGDESFDGVLQIGATQQLGMPEPFFSGPGTITSDGWFDVFGASGGFLNDPSRGIGSPYELLTFELEAIGMGQTLLGAAVSDQAMALGVPDGILLQRDEPVDVVFGNPVLIVVPEPTSGALLLLSILAAAVRRARR
jgi:hypothetical protein